MPKDTSKMHTPESVEIVASRLESIVAQLRVSKDIMLEQPPLKSLEVFKQTSLDVGLSGLRAWADALRDSVDTARMELAVSASPNGAVKPRKKAP